MASSFDSLREDQVAGAVVGGALGLTKGASLGTSAMLATAPFLGPLALLFLPLGTAFGAFTGARVGAKGLGHVALMTVTGPLASGLGEGLALAGDAATSGDAAL